MYIRLNNGTPETYTIGQLRRDNPNTSFPKNIKPATLESYGMHTVFDTPKPTVAELEVAVQSGFELDGLGNWVRSWVVRDMFSDQLDENSVVVKTKAEFETEFLAQKKATQVKQYQDAVQKHLDASAQARGYDSILTMVTYDIPTGGRFKAEAAVAANWRTNVWETAEGILADVDAELRPVPTTEELIAELPVPSWPI